MFIDIENIYDSILQSVIWGRLEAKGVLRMYIRTIHIMYIEVGTCVRLVAGDTQYFPDEEKFHQESL